MNIAVTSEYAFDKLKEALASKDYAEVEKWDKILTASNEARIRAKQRVREIHRENLMRALRESYIIKSA